MIFKFDRYYQEKYKKITAFFQRKESRMCGLRLVYRTAPVLTAVSYAVCLVMSARKGREVLLWNLAVPACVFGFVSVLRYAVDFPRPYEKEQIRPLISKTKKGHSFPSRHAASAAVIAMAWWKLNALAGIGFLMLAVFVAVSRVLAGVHYVRDVLAGFALGVLAGLLPLLY